MRVLRDLPDRRRKGVYPPLAKQARIQGTVLLSVNIAEDGSVKQVQLLSGHPLLRRTAHPALY